MAQFRRAYRAKRNEAMGTDQDAWLSILGRTRKTAFSALNNTLTMHVLNGTPIPRDLFPVEWLKDVRARADEEYRKRFPPGDITRIAIGRFLEELVDRHESVFRGEIRPKLSVFAGHDDTLGPLLVGIGSPIVEHVPPGSTVIFEVYRDEGHPEGKVRILYNGVELAFRECSEEYLGMCTLKQFRQRVQPHFVTNLKELCRVEE